MCAPEGEIKAGPANLHPSRRYGVIQGVVNAEPVQTEAPQKTYQSILEQEITEGLRELQRPMAGLFISGVSAGLDVSFSLFLQAVVLTLAGQLGPAASGMLGAAMYSVGFVLVILGRSELFTEHTTRAVYPVLHGRASLKRLSRLWGLIYVSNVIGTAIFARLVTVIGPALGVTRVSLFGEIARRVVDHPWWVIVLSAMLAGWLMGLVSWLVSAARDTTSQILFVGIITWSIGIAHLHHAIVGSVEVLAAVFARQGVHLGDYVRSVLWTTLGNAAGGVFFVALFKYSHVIRRAAEPAKVNLDEPSSKIITDLSTPSSIVTDSKD
jgi:formate-nitrite transporter family protein